MPQISVLMPVFNAELYLSESIESILNQTFSDFEFIILNDGSTDKSLDIIKSYEHDKRISLIDNPSNIGYTKNLNKGLQLSKGKYIARMDADDVSLITRFETQYDFMEKNPDYGLCGTDIEIMYENNHKVGEKWITIGDHLKLVGKLLFENPICHPSVMIRKSILDENNLKYNTENEPAEEFKLWFEISQYAKIINLDTIQLKYRVNQNQVSQKRFNEQKYKMFQIRTENRLAYLLKHNNDVDLKHFLELIHTNDKEEHEKLQTSLFDKKKYASELALLQIKNVELHSYINKLENTFWWKIRSLLKNNIVNK